jgi:branched-chain amino acid transport system substrate-binding protein
MLSSAASAGSDDPSAVTVPVVGEGVRGLRPGAFRFRHVRADQPRRRMDASGFDRRRLLGMAGITAAALPLSGALAACTGGGGSSGPRPVRIGFVTPRTGTLSDFYDADQYVTDNMRNVLSAGIPVGRSTHPVEIFVRDSQSNRNQTAAATAALIFEDEVDIVLAGGTSETTNQVADQCEAFEVPCITTSAPWESWYAGRIGDTPASDAPFTWTYHFFWGINDLIDVYGRMWGDLDTNGRVGTIYPATTEGQQFSNRFPTSLQSRGVTVIPTDNYVPGQLPARDIVLRFQSEEVEVVTGLMTPEDFAAFWKAADDELYVPKAVTVSRALLFPTNVGDLGGRGNNLTTEVWWSDKHPHKSSLTGVTAQEMAADFREQTGKEWVQPLGFSHALFEVAVAALENVQSLDDRASIAQSIQAVKEPTIVGSIEFGGRAELPKNVAVTSLVGGQWRRNVDDSEYKLFIVSADAENRIAPDGRIEPITPPAPL